MTEEHLLALLGAAEAKKEDRTFTLPEGRLLTLYVASNGASMTVSKVQKVKVDRAFLHAQTLKGEYYVLALEDAFAGAIDAPPSGSRKAGFV
jgi:hypothetical protein